MVPKELQFANLNFAICVLELNPWNSMVYWFAEEIWWTIFKGGLILDGFIPQICV